MKFRPLHDRVLIEVLDGSEKTAGGIIIPDTAQEKPQEGKVVAVGGGAKTEDGKAIPMDVKVGDKVLFGKWSGTEVKIDTKKKILGAVMDISTLSSDEVLELYNEKMSSVVLDISGNEVLALLIVSLIKLQYRSIALLASSLPGIG